MVGLPAKVAARLPCSGPPMNGPDNGYIVPLGNVVAVVVEPLSGPAQAIETGSDGALGRAKLGEARACRKACSCDIVGVTVDVEVELEGVLALTGGVALSLAAPVAAVDVGSRVEPPQAASKAEPVDAPASRKNRRRSKVVTKECPSGN
jgi:hypothetical protein